MPLFRPRTKATELAITIAKWTTGTGIHLHDNVVSHLRLHLAGKNLALLVMILVICIYIYILFVFTCYICLVAMQAGPKASGRNLLYEHVFLQDCKRESAYRRSADAAKQTDTHRHTQRRVYHKSSQGLFQNMSVESLDLWPMYFQSPTQINLTSPCLDITSSWHLFFLTCPSVDGSFSRNLLLLAFLS